MRVCYSKRSKPTARSLSAEGITMTRSPYADINWGKRRANTKLNPDTTNVRNKRLMRQLFAQNGVPMPKLFTLEEAIEYVGNTGKPVIGRPDRHSKGRGLWKCLTIRDIMKAIVGTRKKRAATHFMEYIDTPREYRCHVFLGKSIRLSEKDFDSDRSDARTARGLYVTKKPRHNVAHVRKAAKKALKAVRMDFGAVDVLADDNNAYVLEVNSAPCLGGSLPALYSKKFREWHDEQ